MLLFNNLRLIREFTDNRLNVLYQSEKEVRAFFDAMAKYLGGDEKTKMVSLGTALYNVYNALPDDVIEFFTQKIEEHCGSDPRITLYRGLSFEEPNKQFEKYSTNQKIILKSQLSRFVSSWSDTEEVAESFAQVLSYGVVLEAQIGVNDILVIPDMFICDEDTLEEYKNFMRTSTYTNLLNIMEQIKGENEYIVALPLKTEAVIKSFWQETGHKGKVGEYEVNSFGKVKKWKLNKH